MILLALFRSVHPTQFPSTVARLRIFPFIIRESFRDFRQAQTDFCEFYSFSLCSLFNLCGWIHFLFRYFCSTFILPLEHKTKSVYSMGIFTFSVCLENSRLKAYDDGIFSHLVDDFIDARIRETEHVHENILLSIFKIRRSVTALRGSIRRLDKCSLCDGELIMLARNLLRLINSHG